MELIKDNLKDYDKVIFKNGKEGLYLNEWIYNELGDNVYCLGDYWDNLVNVDNNDYNVVEILRPSYKSVAKREVVKMTVEEIKAIIGYDIEIVEK